MASGEAMSSPFAPLTNQQLHQQQTSSQDQEHPPPPPAKKKRNLPGTPDPEAEVIALSPRTLMATNRFVCEICGKGFQRDQNLQLHRRGHNLPWKLRQRGKDQPRKRVYVCPEKGCLHHNPSRALGDLTGIKKHFCRKHGEKKWKCDKCAKKYAVQSDWKAHAKTCGTREYRCDCGTLFSRRDSFITHRAFCDALAEETARLQQSAAASGGNAAAGICGGGGQSYLFAGSAAGPLSVRPNMMLPPEPGQMPGHGALSLWGSNALPSSLGQNIAGGAPMPMPVPVPAQQMYADLFAPSSGGAQFDMAQLNWLYGNGGGKQLSSSNASELTTTNSSREADSSAPSVFSGQHHTKPSAATADMSATALLQKAAQIGAVTSKASMPLVGGFVEQPVKSPVEERCKFDGGALSFGASHQQQHGANNNNGSSAMSELTAANTGYDVFAGARHGGGLKDAVGREETRDFLGVGMQALCSSSIHGWI